MLLSHLGMISAQTLTTLRSLVASEAAENAFVNAELLLRVLFESGLGRTAVTSHMRRKVSPLRETTIQDLRVLCKDAF